VWCPGGRRRWPRRVVSHRAGGRRAARPQEPRRGAPTVSATARGRRVAAASATGGRAVRVAGVSRPTGRRRRIDSAAMSGRGASPEAIIPGARAAFARTRRSGRSAGARATLAAARRAGARARGPPRRGQPVGVRQPLEQRGRSRASPSAPPPRSPSNTASCSPRSAQDDGHGLRARCSAGPRRSPPARRGRPRGRPGAAPAQASSAGGLPPHGGLRCTSASSRGCPLGRRRRRGRAVAREGGRAGRQSPRGPRICPPAMP
jgi:hypothetical protein